MSRTELLLDDRAAVRGFHKLCQDMRAEACDNDLLSVVIHGLRIKATRARPHLADRFEAIADEFSPHGDVGSDGRGCSVPGPRKKLYSRVAAAVKSLFA